MIPHSQAAMIAGIVTALAFAAFVVALILRRKKK
jgi:multisubunit Na+/H+ antiporter MnhC subunit